MGQSSGKYSGKKQPAGTSAQPGNYGTPYYPQTSIPPPLDRNILQPYFNQIAGYDHQMDRNEFGIFMQQMNPQLGPNQQAFVDQTFMRYDANRDGALDFNEFNQAYLALRANPGYY